MTTRVTDLFLTGTHAALPAAASTPVGALYSCTDHGLIYKNDGATWNTWATLGGSSVLDDLTDVDTTTVAPTNGDVLTFDGTIWEPAAPAAPTTRTINAQTGTTYTLVAGDAGDFVTMTNASASTLTVPPNSSVAFAVGTFIEGAQLGAGQVTLTPGSGVTINGSPGLKVAAQYGTFGLLKTATDTWLAFGRLAA